MMIGAHLEFWHRNFFFFISDLSFSFSAQYSVSAMWADSVKVCVCVGEASMTQIYLFRDFGCKQRTCDRTDLCCFKVAWVIAALKIPAL